MKDLFLILINEGRATLYSAKAISLEYNEYIKTIKGYLHQTTRGAEKETQYLKISTADFCMILCTVPG